VLGVGIGNNDVRVRTAPCYTASFQ